MVLPGIAIVLAMRFAIFGFKSDPLRVLTVEAIAYVIFWVAFPLAMYHLTQALGLAERYRLHIVAYNWSQVIQIAVLVPINVVLFAAGLIETPLYASVFLGLQVVILIYEGYIAHIALKLPRLGALGVALLSFVIASTLDSCSLALRTAG
ncbi:MAG: hypothetical protein QNJ30_10000 [Kiloniellales bacterium]|nr:hypothetical protein [Kiloniellales bacterium]